MSRSAITALVLLALGVPARAEPDCPARAARIKEALVWVSKRPSRVPARIDLPSARAKEAGPGALLLFESTIRGDDLTLDGQRIEAAELRARLTKSGGKRLQIAASRYANVVWIAELLAPLPRSIQVELLVRSPDDPGARGPSAEALTAAAGPCIKLAEAIAALFARRDDARAAAAIATIPPAIEACQCEGVRDQALALQIGSLIAPAASIGAVPLKLSPRGRDLHLDQAASVEELLDALERLPEAARRQPVRTPRAP